LPVPRLARSVLADEHFVVRQEGLQLGRAQIREYQPAQVLAGVSGMLDAVLEGAALRLRGLLQTVAADVVHPTVEGAPEAAVLDRAVGQLRQPMGAAQAEQAGLAV